MEKMEIPPKPDDAFWTDDQWKALTAEGSDILVAAAAGSGKTAVLVERIIRKITSITNPLDVDELLVVTFTNAAAAEMRHRIGEALEHEINKHPESNHLRKQLSLLNRASISTLHSFCQEVIRKYYYLIDVDPGFRVADETEIQLLRDEVLDDLFEEEYGKADNEPFFAVVDSFTSDRSDSEMQEIIVNLYDFSRSNPYPEVWLESIIEMYDVEETQKIDELPFISAALYEIDIQLQGAEQLIAAAYEVTQLPEGPAPRAETYQEDLQIIETLMEARKDSWEALYQGMQQVNFPRAKFCRRADYDEELIDYAAKLRDQGKEIVTKLREDYFIRRPESFLQDMKKMRPHMSMLVYLVKAFAIRFAALKKEKGLADFSDLEHFCLNILAKRDENGQTLPSEAARAYQKRFQEVLVDEYQDTNMVQESIIQLVTNNIEGSGNLFMVGDVKQSIYRFRLAEPNLFLSKYHRFGHVGEQEGFKIDLAQNFRSRKEVLEGTNYIFKQIMDANVGEIEYDESAKLKVGASYPKESFPVELLLIDQGVESSNSKRKESADQEAAMGFDLEELEQSQLEARFIAKQIKACISEGRHIYNPKTKSTSKIMYRDMVILLRSMTWAPQILEELKQQGIPVYANLSTGYFEATEVSIMMSLLKVIDNPLQDIPLAAVLRSPIVQLNEEELARIRIKRKGGTFYDALTTFIRQNPSDSDGELYSKVKRFYLQLQQWRTKARQESLSELIWQLYRDTRFYDYVGGMPGGKQRQANLSALYDRARQYEATSFRGLFRFLRFIERMRDRGDDLGAARALSEQEDVVRIMTIHSSKGLEFPVVFVAGLGRQFNLRDLNKPYLLDKQYGVATKFVDIEKRISVTSLPQLAFKAKKKLEMIAEEMRVLYVALTRAKEKLYLSATVKELDKKIAAWSNMLTNQNWLLDGYNRWKANTFLDWIGPALIRHQDCNELHGGKHISVPKEIVNHPSCWRIAIQTSEQLVEDRQEEQQQFEQLFKKIEKKQPVLKQSSFAAQIIKQLSWTYSFPDAVSHRSKQTVSEVKRQRELFGEDSGTELIMQVRKPIVSRPRFMQEKSLTPAERGTAMHTVMQHIPLDMEMNELSVAQFIESMVQNELLIEEQKNAIDPGLIVAFFATDIGSRLLQSCKVKREVPFSLALPAHEAYPDWQEARSEPVLIQGMIDCLFEDKEGIVLLDYKTDRITNRFSDGFESARPILKKRYRVQIDLYTKAVEHILQRKVAEKILYFFDGAHILKM